VSIYEFINSYRESNYSPYPDIRSEATIKALQMMKKLKEEIASGLYHFTFFFFFFFFLKFKITKFIF